MGKECDVQRKILLYLKSIGAYAVKVVTANEDGVNDILCCYRGRFISIEVKRGYKEYGSWLRGKGTSDAMQKYQMRLVRQAGGIWHISYSVETVKEMIKMIDEDLRDRDLPWGRKLVNWLCGFFDPSGDITPC